MAVELIEHTGGPWGTSAHVDAARVARARGVKHLKAVCRGTLVMAEIILKVVKIEEVNKPKGAGLEKQSK